MHGDPAPPNLLARDGRLSAVIDFGTMAVGDPAVDLIAAWSFVAAQDRGIFRETLCVDDDTWTRGRGWGLMSIIPSPADFADPASKADAQRRVDELISDHRGC